VPAVDRPSGFTSDAARTRFLAAYDRTLERLWPVPVDARDVPTRSGTVRVYRAGPAGNDPVVLLTGAGGNALAWYRDVELLARTRPVLVVDPLGEAGRSVPSRPLATGTDVGKWVTDVLAAVGAERAHLVGVSFGGWTALEQQLSRGGRVAAVTLVDPAGFGAMTARFYRWIILCGMAGMLPARQRRRAARRLVNATINETELMKLGLAGRGFRRRLPTPPVYGDDQLRQIAVPVQVLLGGRSTLHDSTEVAGRLAAVVPEWRVEVVPDAGHALVMDVPGLVVDRVLGFPPTPTEDGAPSARGAARR
jgi:pimeloyl-ACP methyl ester carboxylesterase